MFQAKVEKKRDLENAYVKKRANPQPRKLPAWESDLKIMGKSIIYLYTDVEAFEITIVNLKKHENSVKVGVSFIIIQASSLKPVIMCLKLAAQLVICNSHIPVHSTFQHKPWSTPPHHVSPITTNPHFSPEAEVATTTANPTNKKPAKGRHPYQRDQFSGRGPRLLSASRFLVVSRDRRPVEPRKR